MKQLQKICVITDRYPLDSYPVNTFLDQLVCAFADKGVECDVVAPYCPFIDLLSGKKYKPKFHDVRVTKNGSKINVYCPKFFCPSGRNRFGIKFGNHYQSLHQKSAERLIASLKKNYDIIYAHFIVPATLTAVHIGRKYNTPVFFAYGESSLDIIKSKFSLDFIRKELEYVSGVVAVSSNNRNTLIDSNVIDGSKIEVFSNSIDTEAFYAMDKKTAREQLGFSQEDYIVAFVGHFINRKGSLRVSKALEKLENIKSIFIGKGPEEPECEGILFKGPVPHDKIVTYLNAADVFVLPTLAEGCCNAIVEAMACGLPIISSNLPFNDDILNDENSIRIDPNNVDEIANAINDLKNNLERRDRMSDAALTTAASLTIDKRAQNILAFIGEAL